MARTIAQIKQAIIDAKNADSTLSGLTSSSSVAIFNLWMYVTAVAQWTLENLFDFFKADVNAAIAAGKPHTLRWYAKMAKAFQYGVTLPADSDVYAVVPPVDPTVLIVTYAAAVEVNSSLRIKVAKTTGGALAPLAGGELAALTTYMGRIKDAGVRLIVTSGAGDNLQLVTTIYYDALVLKADGSRIDGTATTPVKDAIKAFLAALPFNGLFVYNNLISALQAVDGVVIGDVNDARAWYSGPPPYYSCMTQYQPDAGYLVLDDTYFDSNVTYVAHEPI